MEQEKSRIAEIAMELFGAQAANKFLSEAWASASSDVKERVAKIIIDTALPVATKMVEDYKWNEIGQWFGKLVTKILDEHRVEIEAHVRKRVEAELPKFIAQCGDEALATAKREASREIASRFNLR